MAQSHRGKRKREGFGIDGSDYREEARPCMTADEIRRTKKAILIIRQNKPLLTDVPDIAEIAPWRKQVSPNPFYGGKPYLKRVKLNVTDRMARVRRTMNATYRKRRKSS